MRVMVAGASGFVGRRLCAALQDAGHKVVAMTRHPDSYQGAGDAAYGDVHKTESLGGVPVTTLRAGITDGHGGISWELTRQLVAHC